MLEIREMVEADAKFIVQFNERTDKDFLAQWAGRFYTYPITKEQIVERIKNREKTRYFSIIIEKKVIGTFELDFINWGSAECTVCRFLIDKGYRNMGYGEKSLNLLVDYAFNIMKMKKVKLAVFDFNTGAIKCYENSGFSIIGKAVRPNGWIVLEMERTKESE